jgi:hypothetical protein
LQCSVNYKLLTEVNYKLLTDEKQKLLTDASCKLLIDPSHKLFTHANHTMADEKQKLQTDARHKLLTDASHKLLTGGSHKLRTAANHKLLTDCLSPSSSSLSPVSLPACLSDYFTNLLLHDPRFYLDSFSSSGKIKQPFKFKFKPLFFLRTYGKRIVLHNWSWRILAGIV